MKEIIILKYENSHIGDPEYHTFRVNIPAEVYQKLSDCPGAETLTDPGTLGQ